jgi:hypothetical protein
MPNDMISIAITTLREALGGEFAAGEHWDFETIHQATKVVVAARKLCEHDGGPGSRNFDAHKTYAARRSMRNALGMYPTKSGTFGSGENDLDDPEGECS